MKKPKRKCKVRGCERGYHSLGYCEIHYNRKKRGKQLINKCRDCGKKIEHLVRYRFCESCSKKRKRKKNRIRYLIKGNQSVHIPQLGIKGVIRTIYTNGVTEEIKPMISKIRDKVLEDCINNPRKYLD